MADGQEIAWTTIQDRTPVVDSTGEEIGHVDSVLGDEQKDVFHGLAVNLKGLAGLIEVPANRVTTITADEVRTDLAGDEASTLEAPS